MIDMRASIRLFILQVHSVGKALAKHLDIEFCLVTGNSLAGLILV